MTEVRHDAEELGGGEGRRLGAEGGLELMVEQHVGVASDRRGHLHQPAQPDTTQPRSEQLREKMPRRLARKKSREC